MHRYLVHFQGRPSNREDVWTDAKVMDLDGPLDSVEALSDAERELNGITGNYWTTILGFTLMKIYDDQWAVQTSRGLAADTFGSRWASRGHESVLLMTNRRTAEALRDRIASAGIVPRSELEVVMIEVDPS